MVLQDANRIIDIAPTILVSIMYGAKYAEWYKDRHPVTGEILDYE